MPKMTLPSGLTVEYRGMTGRDEDLLTNRKKLMSGEALDEVLKNCTTAIGDRTTVMLSDIETLITPDRVALLLGIRRESYGDDMAIEVECSNPECKAKMHLSVDLSTIETKPLPEGERPFETTVDGKKVLFDYLNGKRERSLSKTKEDLLTAAMSLRLVEVEGVHVNDHKKWLRELPVKARSALRAAMAATDAGPLTDKTADCAECGEENQFNVQAQSSFFFPAS